MASIDMKRAGHKWHLLYTPAVMAHTGAAQPLCLALALLTPPEVQQDVGKFNVWEGPCVCSSITKHGQTSQTECSKVLYTLSACVVFIAAGDEVCWSSPGQCCQNHARPRECGHVAQ